ncbi:MAG: hypothetical protein NUV46_04790 [Nanoarchaeota archaeon]|nr:hypothetical protein [Nanoarchaeota archaeon]
MDGEASFKLPGFVDVFLKSEKGNLEKILKLVESNDTLNEIDIMKKIGDFPPFSLFVYKDFLGWGNYHIKDKGINLTFTDYSDPMFMDWVDCSFSFKNSPLRVVKKMGDLIEFSRRLELRTKFDWVKYDFKTGVMKEDLVGGCVFKKTLDDEDFIRKEIYSLYEEGNVAIANRFWIEESKKDLNGEIDIKCSTDKKVYPMSVGAVEEMILSSDPNALIIKEPFLSCSRNIVNLPPCISRLFLTSYIKKRNFKVRINPNMDPTRLSEENLN